MSLVAVGAAWPAGTGEVAKLIRVMDWARTSLGPCRAWPRSLKTVLDLMLPARAEMALFWGPDYLTFYNDAYAPVIGNKHPRALGQPARVVFSELWADLEPLLAGVLATGETFSAQDRPFLINRRGEP